MQEWFVCVPGGATVGPVSTSLLILGLRSGKVPDDALVQRAGESDWQGVLEVPEFAAAMAGPGAFDAAAADGRYAVKSLLGRGGMGEVYLCGDGWIGRDVAMKVALGGQDSALHLRARFVREALVQGQLEHPSIVPVYDLGARTDGATFFTMKRVRGLTLAQVIQGLRRDDAATKRTYSRRRLLTAMSSVCLAVSFAHSRGVVHRDLKPDNIMLGDFGEVYVLDWGVARVLDDSWAQKASTQTSVPIGKTLAGALVGTPGYAAPEQVQGDKGVGERSDVYGLGAILFEILALAPFHKGASIEALVTSTLISGPASPRARAPELAIPPELDAICVRATAPDPANRFGSARELQEAIERYLDGERDAERRRDLARQHADAAAEAFAAAPALTGAAAETERVRGLRELGAALALDPSNEAVVETLVRVLFDAPGELPPEAEAELKALENRDRPRGARDTGRAYMFMALSAPLLLLMPILRPWLFGGLVAAVVATAAYLWWMWHTGKAAPRYMGWSLPLIFLVVALTSSIFGPFVITPGTAVVSVATLLVNLRANRAVRIAVPLLALSAILLPAALQFAHLVPPSYIFEHDSVRIVSNLVAIRPVPAMLLLAVGSSMTILAAVYSVGNAVDALVASERRSFAQAWRLRQLLPSGSRISKAP